MSWRDEPEYITIDYDDVIAETEEAVLLRIDEDEIWIPRSQIRDHNEEAKQLDIPEWLAYREDLI